MARERWRESSRHGLILGAGERMNFDITATPTLEAVASADDRTLAQDLNARVEEARLEAEQDPGVKESVEAHRVAQAAVENLQAAARALNTHTKHLREHIG